MWLLVGTAEFLDVFSADLRRYRGRAGKVSNSASEQRENANPHSLPTEPLLHINTFLKVFESRESLT